MEHLWSPWRLAYITGTAKATDCVFCPAGDATELAGEELVVFRGDTCFVILNLFPYNSGHLMVVPRRHVATLASLRADELAEMMLLTQRSEIALTRVYQPQGINVGINLGRPAGAGIIDHIHIHLVPRWTGDTNFMTVIGQTRVLPQELPVTADRLRPIFEKLAAQR